MFILRLDKNDTVNGLFTHIQNDMIWEMKQYNTIKYKMIQYEKWNYFLRYLLVPWASNYYDLDYYYDD